MYMHMYMCVYIYIYNITTFCLFLGKNHKRFLPKINTKWAVSEHTFYKTSYKQQYISQLLYQI